MKKQTLVVFKPLVWPFLLVILVALLMMLAATQVKLLDQDENIYALVALDLLNGKLPYQGIFDHKPLGVYYLYAAVFSILGEEYVAIRIMSICFLLGTAFNISLGLSKFGFGGKARLAAVATILAFPIGLDGLAGNTEIMQSFFLSLLFLVACYGYKAQRQAHYFLFFLYGFFVGIAFSINYLFSFIGLFSYLATILCFFYVGKLHFFKVFLISAFVFLGFVFASLLVYSQYWIDYLKGGVLLQNYLTDQNNFLSGYKYELNKQRVIDRFFVWVVPFFPVLIAGIFSYIKECSTYFIVTAFAIATFIAAGIAASMSLSFFHHYWILATVPIALFAALAMEKSKDKMMLSVLCYSLSGVLLLYIVFGSEKIVNQFFDNAEGKDLSMALEFIDENISSQDKVAAILVSPAYFYLQKLYVDQKYVFPNHIPKLKEKGLIDGDQYFLNALSASVNFALVRPTLCEDERLKYPKTCDYLERNFNPLASFEGYHPVTIHQYAPR